MQENNSTKDTSVATAPDPTTNPIETTKENNSETSHIIGKLCGKCKTCQNVVCQSCWRSSKTFGELIPGHFLFEHKNRYGIITEPGHGPLATLWFDTKPWSDPDPDCEREDCPESDRWVDEVTDWEEKQKFCAITGYELVKACLESGYSRESDHPLILQWLFNRAGQMLEGKQ